jgi:amino acid permease
VQLELTAFISQIPVASSWTVFAGRFIDPSIGFAVSWSYWFNIITGLASELMAAANVVAYWNEVRNPRWMIVLSAVNLIIMMYTLRTYQLGLCQLFSG